MEQHKQRLSTWIVGLALLMGTASQAAVYCSGASDAGFTWWTWTVPNQDTACGIVFKKILGANQPVNRGYWGNYNPSGLNNGTLICKQGQRSIIGNGTDVFTAGLNMRSQLGWSGCVIRVN